MKIRKLNAAIVAAFSLMGVNAQAAGANNLVPFSNIYIYSFKLSPNGLYAGGDDSSSSPAVPSVWDISGNALMAYPAFANLIDISNNGTLVLVREESLRGRSYLKETNNISPVKVDSLYGEADSSEYAKAISSDGRTVVGYAINHGVSINGSNPIEAFIWTRNNGIMGLGYLYPGHLYSGANDVSANGSVVVGTSLQADGLTTASFRWEAGVMTEIPKMSGQLSGAALRVSEDGNVVAGVFKRNFAYNDAYIWTRSDNQTREAVKPAGLELSDVTSVSLAGDGKSAFFNYMGVNGSSSFRWSQTEGTARISDWLISKNIDIADWTRILSITSTNMDGTLLAGSGLLNNVINNFIIRVESDNAGLVVIEDVIKSVKKQSTLSLTNSVSSIAGMVLNGAHHLTLIDMAVGKGENCAWGSFDIGRSDRNGKGWVNLSEVGACKDFGDIKFGLGVGFSSSSIGYAGEGRSKLSGQYLVSELNWTHQDSGTVLSALGIAGNWNADIRRDYTGTSSAGDTDVNMQSLRLRADFKNLWSAGDVSFTPVAQMTVTRTRVGNYQETGGTAPAQFDTQSHLAYESRLGLNAEYALSSKNSILGRTEWVKRFDSAHLISGSAMALGAIQVPFNFRASEVKDNWMRAGFDVIYKPTQNSRVALSATASTPGQDADYVVGLNWTGVF